VFHKSRHIGKKHLESYKLHFRTVYGAYTLYAHAWWESYKMTPLIPLHYAWLLLCPF